LKLDNIFLVKAVIFFILGLITGYYFLNFRLILIISLAIILIFFLFDNTKKLYIILLIIIFIFGFIYLLYYEINYDSKYSITKFNGQVVEVIGKIDHKLDSLEGNSIVLKPILINNKKVKYGKIQLYKDQIPSDITQSDLVIARIKLNRPQKKRNPGGFSYFKYLKKQHIYSVGNVFELYKIQSYNSFKTIIIKIKKILLSSINNKIPPPVNEFIKALILGEKSGLNQNWENNFRKAGANHLLAISGLHIGFITMFLLMILKPFSVSLSIENIILSIFLITYIIMTGLRSSVLRASFLVLIYRYCKQLNIKIEFSGLISLVLFLVLLINPYQLFSIGLQLSFLVLLMIISWSKLLEKNLHPALAVSIAAQLGSIPLTAYYFNTITPAGIITNLWAVPMVTLIVFLILSHFTVYLLFPIISNITGRLIYFLSIILKRGINIMSDLPSAEIKVATPSIITVLLMYIILFSLSYLLKIKGDIRYRFKYKIFSIIIIVSLIFTLSILFLPKPSNNLLDIYCLDVGQGDSIFIETPDNKRILVDTGGMSGSTTKVKSTIIPFLLQKRIKSIDYLIISHFDGDHCSDADFLISKGFVKNLVVSKHVDKEYKKTKEIIKSARDQNIRVLMAGNKDILKLVDLNLEFLGPLHNIVYENRNNNSVVFRLKYKTFEMLFTGDIEKEAEINLVKQIPKKYMKADIIKIAHHGSNTSSFSKFIKKVQPKESIISVGFNNFGHPDQKILDRLNKFQSRVWRTDKSGAVIIKTNGLKYSINSYIN